MKRAHKRKRSLVEDTLQANDAMRAKFERAESTDVLAHFAMCERCEAFDFDNRCPVCARGLIPDIEGEPCTSFGHKLRRVFGRYKQDARVRLRDHARKLQAQMPPPEPAKPRSAAAPPPRAAEPAAPPAGPAAEPAWEAEPDAAPAAPPPPPPPRPPPRPMRSARGAAPPPPPPPPPPPRRATAAAPPPPPPPPPPPRRAPPPPKPKEPSALEKAYETLGLKADASDDDVRKAFRDKAKACHPDRVAHLAPEFKALAEKQMLELNMAYDAIMRAREAAAKTA